MLDFPRSLLQSLQSQSQLRKDLLMFLHNCRRNTWPFHQVRLSSIRGLSLLLVLHWTNNCPWINFTLHIYISFLIIEDFTALLTDQCIFLLNIGYRAVGGIVTVCVINGNITSGRINSMARNRQELHIGRYQMRPLW